MSEKLRERRHVADLVGGTGGTGYGDDGPGDGGVEGGGGLPIPTPKLMVWLFLIVPTLVFASLASAFVVRMGMPGWQSLPVPAILWLNTGLLVAASGALQRAVGAQRRASPSAWRWFHAGGALATLFLLGQALAWIQMFELGYGLLHNPSGSFFYLITALHGLHLLGGVGAWLWTTGRARAALRHPGRDRDERAGLRMELCALYGHVLLAIWLAMFAMIGLG